VVDEYVEERSPETVSAPANDDAFDEVERRDPTVN
jgi:hypothetical protein